MSCIPCSRWRSEDKDFENVLTSTDLTQIQKDCVRKRFINVVREFRNRCWRFSLLFYTGHFIVTVGSLLVPALLSVQYTDTGINFVSSSQFQGQVYWSTWVLSLMVTTFNGILSLFKVDKKYYFLHTTLERLRSEGWQYFQLTGRYAGGLIHYSENVTYANQYKFFCHYVEKIKLKQVEEEYYKYDETANQLGQKAAETGNQQTSSQDNTQDKARASFYPPSIDAKLDSIAKNIPQSIHDAVRALRVTGMVNAAGQLTTVPSNTNVLSSVAQTASHQTIEQQPITDPGTRFTSPSRGVLPHTGSAFATNSTLMPIRENPGVIGIHADNTSGSILTVPNIAQSTISSTASTATAPRIGDTNTIGSLTPVSASPTDSDLMRELQTDKI